MGDNPQDFLDRLFDATNAHDLDRLVDCFAEDYVNETPAHPARGFTGRDRVRANWQQIFAFVPDVQAELVVCAVDGQRVWVEQRMHGTRLDGTRHEMRGVIVFTVTDGRASSARFFLEPVDEASTDVAAAVDAQVHAGPAS
jgi:ketosteroid isomerase-like protein